MKPRGRMLVRVVRLMALIVAEPCHPTEVYARALGVCTRTIYRDLDAVMDIPAAALPRLWREAIRVRQEWNAQFGGRAA